MRRRTEALPLSAAMLALLAAWSCAPPPAQGPSTDLYLLEMTADGGLATGEPVNLTDRQGYDNQPGFLPDGRSLLYVSRTDGRTDLFELDIDSRESRRVTTTTIENEYSPRPVPGSDRISLIRVERAGAYRLLTADRDGGDIRAVTDLVHDPIGYYAWIDAKTVAVVVSVEPSELLLIDLERHRFRSIAENVGRSIQAIPGRRALSFVHFEGKESWIKEYAVDAREIRLIAPLAGGGDHAWTPDGLLLAGRGSELLGLTPGLIPAWEPLANLTAAGLDEITRIAVSPTGKHLILVAEPGDP